MSEETKKRPKLTVSKLGKSALKAGAQSTDDNHGTTTPHKYEDCAGDVATYFNDNGTRGKTMSR